MLVFSKNIKSTTVACSTRVLLEQKVIINKTRNANRGTYSIIGPTLFRLQSKYYDTSVWVFSVYFLIGLNINIDWSFGPKPNRAEEEKNRLVW